MDEETVSLLKGRIEKADYEIYSAIDKTIAVHAIQEARGFLKAAENYLKVFLE